MGTDNLRSCSILYVVEPDTILNPVAFRPHYSFTTTTTTTTTTATTTTTTISLQLQRQRHRFLIAFISTREK